MIYSCLFAGLASAAFSYIFNLKGKKLFFAGLCGATGYFVYLLCGPGRAFSLFVAGIAITLLAELLARFISTPATLFLVGGLLPLVPGGEMFHMFFAVMQHRQIAALTHFWNTLLKAGALAAGAVFVGALFQMRSFIKEKKAG